MSSEDRLGPGWLELVRPGDTIAWGQADAQPRSLTRALLAHRQRIERGRLFLGIGHASEVGPEHADVFEFLSYCGSGSNRQLSEAGLLDVIPCHYSQLPGLIASGDLRVDAVLLQVPPPDLDGRYSLGLAADYLQSAIDHARVVVAEVNDRLPFVHGDRYLTEDQIQVVSRVSRAHVATAGRMDEVTGRIARHVGEWIVDRSTLQVGIGNIPDAVLALLGDRRDLGIHSGAIGDGLVALEEAGAISNLYKGRDPGISVAGLLIGSERLHAFVDRNPTFSLRGAAYTHDAQVLASLSKLVAINSAIEVDLTGQVNAETAGGLYLGAVGGGPDFLRGARASAGGVPIVALPSTGAGRSRIVHSLSGPVSTSRSDAGVIVTEHGSADLRGLSLGERVRRMLTIAHPAHRAELETHARRELRKSGALSI